MRTGRSYQLSACSYQLSALSSQPESFQFPVSSFQLRTASSEREARGAPARPSPLAPRLSAFSLIELMIAIMILGLGLVMVATVFPVSLDITRDTLQKDITLSAVQTAEATLRIKAPLQDPVYPYNSLMFYRNSLIDLVAQGWGPGLWGTEDDSVPDVYSPTPDKAVTDATDPLLWPNLPPRILPSWILSDPVWTKPGNVARARAFTGKSAWDGEFDGFNTTFIMPQQNVLYVPTATGGKRSLSDLRPISPPFIQHIDPTTGKPAFRREILPVGLADNVYPPVQAYRLDNEKKPFDGDARNTGTFNPYVERFDPATYDSANPTTDEAQYLQDILSRRYFWTAIHHRISSSDNVRDMLLSIAITHRSELNNRFARQAGNAGVTGYNVAFDISPAAYGTPNFEQLSAPQPDVDPSTDTVFPQPWLAWLGEMDGEGKDVTVARCTPGLARLLQQDAFFVVAQSVPPDSGTPIVYAGTTFRVLSSHYDVNAAPATFQMKWQGLRPEGRAQLELAGPRVVDGGGILYKQRIPIWVFPPPITRDSTGKATFGPRSPVVGVGMGRVN
jgi:type II secretory pathway pseudopilin PulG